MYALKNKKQSGNFLHRITSYYYISWIVRSLSCGFRNRYRPSGSRPLFSLEERSNPQIHLFFSLSIHDLRNTFPVPLPRRSNIEVVHIWVYWKLGLQSSGKVIYGAQRVFRWNYLTFQIEWDLEISFCRGIRTSLMGSLSSRPFPDWIRWRPPNKFIEDCSWYVKTIASGHHDRLQRERVALTSEFRGAIIGCIRI